MSQEINLVPTGFSDADQPTAFSFTPSAYMYAPPLVSTAVANKQESVTGEPSRGNADQDEQVKVETPQEGR